MNLSRYAIRPLPDLKTGPQSFVVRLRGAHTNPKSCVFMTSTRLRLSTRARDVLSITYLPEYRSDFDVQVPASPHDYELETNMRRPVRTDRDAARAPRVWPAFGHLGGAHEVVALSDPGTSVSIIALSLGHVRMRGRSGFDPFRQDAVEAYVRSELIRFAVGVGTIVQTNAGGVADTDGVWVRQHESGLILMWGAGGILYSLSVGYRANQADVLFRLWGAAWQDEKDHPTRHIVQLPPKEVKLPRHGGPAPGILPDPAALEPTVLRLVRDLSVLSSAIIMGEPPRRLPN
jgi:hypothetical protein